MSSIRATPTAGARAAHTLDQPHALDQSQNADRSESADRSGAADQPEGPSRSRAGAAEVIGTFFLVYAGTATAAAAHLGETIAGSPADSLAIALAFGFVLAAMVAGLGQVSGAHLNGAVTLGLAVTGRFPWRFVPTYLLCQLFGAVLGAGATWATLGERSRTVAQLGATFPAPGVGELRAVVVEALITFLLVFVIIATAGDDRVTHAVAAPAIGFALVGAVLIGGPVTGGAANPDRALGPMLLAWNFTSLWVYLVGPLVGGVVAAVTYDRFVSRTTAPSTD
jgi:MIP family channel proteins